MDHVVFDKSETYTNATRAKGPLRRFLGRLIFLACFLGALSLLALEATEPFGKPDACANCHEMQAVRDRWSASSHFSNPSGVTVGCIDCHLPPREDTFDHLYAKTHKGASHGWTHFFGEFDQTASRQLVLDTLPSSRCTHCHNNLTAKPSIPAVGAVHATAVKETGTRTYACVTCHNYTHSKKPPPPEPNYYDQADNSFCYVCHINFKKEPFVLQHKAANIGCVDCHGDSQPHADDEDNTTAPMIMFTKDMVNASCAQKGCHREAKMKKVVSHIPWYAGADPDKSNRKYCTDCHGRHRIDDRQRKWDKKTRKLIWADGYDVDPNAAPTTKPDDEEGMSM